MRIKMLQRWRWGDDILPEGTILEVGESGDVPEQIAQEWMEMGIAKRCP